MDPSKELPNNRSFRAPHVSATLAAGEELSLSSPIQGCSLGVRGLIRDVRGDSIPGVVSDLTAALTRLYDEQMRRVHLVLPHAADSYDLGSTIRMAAEQCGFHECPGEKLFTRHLDSRPLSQPTTRGDYTLRDGTFDDIRTIGFTLTHVRELAFESWEFPLISDAIGRSDRFFKVIQHGNELVGLSIGGSHTDTQRGTISHTWVHPDHRWAPERPTSPRLGKWLSDESLAALYDGGARSIHLMTVDNNPGADSFWTKQGFSMEHESFLEIDL